MTSIKYWHNLGSMVDKARDNIPKQCIIGDTFFTPLESIGGNVSPIMHCLGILSLALCVKSL